MLDHEFHKVTTSAVEHSSLYKVAHVYVSKTTYVEDFFSVDIFFLII